MLPEGLAFVVKEFLSYVEEGNMERVVALLKLIRDYVMDPARAIVDVPIDLSFEYKHFLKATAYPNFNSLGAQNETNKPQLQVIC